MRMIPSENVLTWAKIVELQRAQVAEINSLYEVKNFDAILQKDEGKQRYKTSHICETVCKKKIQILQSYPQSEMVLSIWVEV